jgi:PAS domain S-box-containing protein
MAAKKNRSERKHASDAVVQRLAALVKSSTDAVFSKDLEGTIRTWSRGAERLYGYSRDEVVGRSVALLVPEDRANELATIMSRIRAGEPIEQLETERVCKDGQRVAVAVTISPVRDSAGKVVSASVIERDIINRRAMEDALRRAQDELEQRVADRMAKLRQSQQLALQTERLVSIGQTVTALDHEGRNALQRAVGWLTLLEMRLEGRAAELDLAQRSRQALEDLEHVFNDLRDCAVPILLNLRACDLRSLWRNAWSQAVELRSGRDARLEEKADGPEPACQADPIRLQQVFSSLFRNALEACPDPVRVVITCRQVSLDDRPALQISIQDNRPGFPPEQRERVLEPLFTTKAKGTLAIARRVIETHGGNLTLEGDQCGAKIILILPREPEGSRPTVIV